MLKRRQDGMTVVQFIDWWDRRQEPEARFELYDGVPIRLIGPETVGHGRAKMRVTMRLNEAIRQAGLDYEAVIDSANVAIDDVNSCIPDAAVLCGGG